MTFLNSIFLAALTAALIPLLIHFLSRRRIKIIDFSSLKFLSQMQKSKLRWLRILEILLLAIRMLILVLVAMAFARPALTGKRASSHAPASVVFLLDDSPSVEVLSPGGTVFDEMKRSIDNIIGILGANDDVTLITLSGDPVVVGPSSDVDRLRARLYELQPQPGPPSIREGLKKAADVLRRSYNLNREIYIFSDFQSGYWWDGAVGEVDPQFRYFAVRFQSEDVDNVGLTKIEFPPQLLAPGEEFEITAIVGNSGKRPVEGKLVELFLDNLKRAQTSVDIEAAKTAAAGFAVIPEKPGHHWGYFQIEDDDYSPDNRFYFDFEIPEKIQVLGAGGSQADTKMLDNILGRTATGYIEFTGTEMSAFSRQNLQSYDVVVLNNIEAMSPANLTVLADYLASDGGLLVLLGARSNPESFASFLQQKADIRLLQRVDAFAETESEGPRREDESYFYLRDFDVTHPIFKVYAQTTSQAPEITPIRLSTFIPLEGGTALAKVASAAAMRASTGGKSSGAVLAVSDSKRILVAGFGLDRESSDISLHSFVVPFVIRSVEHLASAPSLGEEYFLSGRPVTLTVPAGVSATSAILSRYDAVSAEKKELETIEISRSSGGAYVNIPAAGYPGFYSLTSQRDTVVVFSVNHDSAESVFDGLDSDHVHTALGADVTVIDGQGNVEAEIMQAKFGLELWKYALVLALILLATESVLVRKAG